MANRPPSRVLRIPAPVDRALVRFVQELFEQKIVQSGQITLAGRKTIELSDHDVVKAINEQSDVVDALGDGTHTVITFVGVNAGATRLEFERGITGPANNAIVSDQFEAEFYFGDSNAPGDRHDAVLRRLASESFTPLESKSLGSDPTAKAFSKHVQRLSDLAAKVTENLVHQQTAADERLQERLKELEKDFDDRRRKLEEKIENESVQITERAERLDDRESDLDTQEARHERRAIRQRITERIQARLSRGQSGQIQRSRYVVLVLSVFGSLAFFLLSIQTALNTTIGQILTDGVSVGEVADLIKIIAGGALSVTLLFYALNFWRKKLDEDERHDRILERYSLDIDRGSWIVETVLDIRSESPDAEIPQAWLQGVSAGLFPLNSSQEPEDTDAVDALGILLSKGASFRISPSGAEIEVTDKASRRIGKDAD